MRIVLAILVSVAACGSDEVDLTGTYRVESAVGSAPCGADATITYPAFLRFERMEIFGQPFFSYEGCTDEAASDCDSMGGVLGGFFEPNDDGWTGQTTFSSGGGDFDCTLGLTVQSATLRGSRLVVEVSTHNEEVSGLPEAECEPEEAERRGTDMPCVEHSLVDATQL